MKFMKYIFWWVGLFYVFFSNGDVISDDARYLACVMTMLAGCYVFKD